MKGKNYGTLVLRFSYLQLLTTCKNTKSSGYYFMIRRSSSPEKSATVFIGRAFNSWDRQSKNDGKNRQKEHRHRKRQRVTKKKKKLLIKYSVSFGKLEAKKKKVSTLDNDETQSGQFSNAETGTFSIYERKKKLIFVTFFLYCILLFKTMVFHKPKLKTKSSFRLGCV